MSKKNKTLVYSNTYTPKERNMYLLGMLGQNMIYNIVSTGLYFYFQNVIFVPAMALGIIMAIGRVWDAINDPIMGTIVDRTHSKWGKCRPYLIFAPAVIGIITILCFCNGIYTQASPTGQVLILVWMAVGYLMWDIAFTAADVPLWGITALMTDSEKDRSKILAFARIAAGIGGIMVLITTIGQAIGGLFQKGIDTTDTVAMNNAMQKGFVLTAVVCTVIGTLLFQCAAYTKERVSQTEERHTLIENIKLMWQNKPYRQILISSILRAPLQLLMIVAMTLLTYYFGNGNMMTALLQLVIIGGAVFGGQFGAMALVPKIIEKVEKKTFYNACSLIGAIPFVLIFVVYSLADPAKGGLDQPLWLAIAFFVFLLAGASMGAVNVMQSVMIADCVDYEEYVNPKGIRPDGIFFSGQSFCTKLGAGIATIISSLVYEYVGYSDSNVEAMVNALNNGANFKTDYESYAAAMMFLVSIPPAIGLLLSVIPTIKYALSDKEHARMLEELKVLRAQRAAANGETVPAADTAAESAPVQDDAQDNKKE